MDLELIEVSTDNQKRTTYEPIVAKIGRKGNYGNAWAIEGLREFWDYSPRPDQGFIDIQLGQTYRMTLTTKPKTGPNARPGAQYHDIRSIEPVDAQASSDAAQDTGPPPSVPEGAPAPKAAVRGSQPPPRPPWEVTDLAYYHRRDAMIALQVEVKARVELAAAFVVESKNDTYEPTAIDAAVDALDRLKAVSDPVLFPDAPEAATEAPSTPDEAVEAQDAEDAATIEAMGTPRRAFSKMSHLLTAAEEELRIDMSGIVAVLGVGTFNDVDFKNPDTWQKLADSQKGDN